MTNALLIIAVLFQSNLLLGQTTGGAEPKEWKSLVGKKYQGPDENLRRFKLSDFEVICNIVGKCFVSYRNNTTRDGAPTECFDPYLCNLDHLSEYKIHFRVLNRKSKKVLEKSYIWTARPKRIKDHIDGIEPSLHLPNVNLAYSIVEYWVSDIKWTRQKKLKRNSSGRVAFSIDEQLDNIKRRKSKKRQKKINHAALISLIENITPLKNFDSKSFKKVFYIKSRINEFIKFSKGEVSYDSYTNHDSYCSRKGCLVGIFETKETTQNMSNDRSQVKSICEALISEVPVKSCRLKKGLFSNKEACQPLSISFNGGPTYGSCTIIESDIDVQAMGSQKIVVFNWRSEPDRLKIGNDSFFVDKN